jgi:hypothetical protein
MAAVANDPAVIDSSLQTLVDAFNAELGPDEQDKRIVFEQEGAGGRVWSTMKAGGLPFGVTWTYDRGYMVAASDRASAERAIATRNGGSQLVWSPAFLAQLPSSAGLHPSAFAWLNAKGAFGVFSALARARRWRSCWPGATRCSSCSTERRNRSTPPAARISSRGRDLIMDVMLLESPS